MLLLSIKSLFVFNKSKPSLQMEYFNLNYGYIILFFFINSLVYSQTDIIDVTTTGVGISKDEATKNALRNALESSFGAFISSKTEIVNDEIVNDEITSISTGNIVSYEIVSSLVEENNHFVTVNSQVSLVSFSSTFIHLNNATPPPATIPSSTAALVACKASSTLSFFSFISISEAAPTYRTATPPANFANLS